MNSTVALIACGPDILLRQDPDDTLRLPEGAALASPPVFTSPELVAGRMDQCPEGLLQLPQREACAALSPEEFRLAAKGLELLNWDTTTRFCAACGSRLEKGSEISRCCPECRKEYFPPLAPAIVVLVTKGDEALLVQTRAARRPYHALVAGFVETGESLEQCVAREVKEETSLDITDIRYVGSQSWPFPGQLMVGFTARYAGGDIFAADGELAHAAFFSRHNPPQIPPPPSLTNAIITAWLEGRDPAAGRYIHNAYQYQQQIQQS